MDTSRDDPLASGLANAVVPYVHERIVPHSFNDVTIELNAEELAQAHKEGEAQALHHKFLAMGRAAQFNAQGPSMPAGRPNTPTRTQGAGSPAVRSSTPNRSDAPVQIRDSVVRTREQSLERADVSTASATEASADDSFSTTDGANVQDVNTTQVGDCCAGRERDLPSPAERLSEADGQGQVTALPAVGALTSQHMACAYATFPGPA